MPRSRAFLCLLVLSTLALCTPIGTARAQTHNGIVLVHADLLADTTAIAPGKPFLVGLHLQMAPHWHTYWQYSGDAGLPTKIDWQLPPGFSAGPIQWPLPDKIVSPGDIINYGYSDDVMLLTTITPPAELPAGEIALKAKATWLVCEEICIPGDKDLALTLPAGGAAQPANTELFQKYGALLPTTGSGTGRIDQQSKLDGKNLVFDFSAPDGPPVRSLDFFPLPGDSAEVGHPGDVALTKSGAGWTARVSVEVVANPKDAGQVGGVLALTYADGHRTAVQVAPLNKGAADPTAAPAANVATTATSPADAAPKSLWHFLLLGFLGGLILNVMPCVLPVISLKLFSFVKQANESPARVFRLGLAYAAGVFAWFLGFAGLVVALRAAGHQVGYAFHLQNPWFLVGLSAATFVFALNLLGVFEIILPGTVTNAAGEASGRDGYAGAFVQGMLATVLGSACTAPVFGEALAFAFSQSALGIFAMFAAIALGMSAPFLLLSAQPGWLKFLPKPGAWMERVKQATGFLLLATVLWLLWTLGRSKGSDGVVWAGALLLILGIACWIQGAFNTLIASNGTRWLARLTILALVVGGGWWCVGQISEAAPPVSNDSNIAFGAQLDSALKSGRPVFVDFTAAWCVSCKVNERVVLGSEPVQKAFRDGNILVLKADYTVYSADIAKLLKQFNAASVPLYVVYPTDRGIAPIVLPTLLTEQVVLSALSQAQGHPLAQNP